MNMKLNTPLTILFLSLLSFNSRAQSISQEEVNSHFKSLPFKMNTITLPKFPEKYFNIVNFGAVPDGLTKNTRAIQKAIDECASSGGGYVIIPSGLWLTAPIQLRSKINLHLEKGALVVFSPDHTDFNLINSPGSTSFELMSGLYGYKIENVAITGEGLFNGNGDTWRPVKKSKLTEAQWKKLTRSGVMNNTGDMWWPSKQAMNAEEYLATKMKSKLTKEDYENIRDYMRPHLLYLEKSINILLENFSLQNSPKYAMNLRGCENVIISKLKVMNDWWAQNGDGLDLSACKNVLMTGCTVNAGDDGICVKSSGKPKDAPAAENIIIEDCVVYAGHGGFVIGSNTDGGINNVSVRNCNFIGTDTGLRFKSGIGRGGIVQNIFIENIYMKGIANEAVIFDMFYEDKGAAKTLDAVNQEKIPAFRKIRVNNLVCDGAESALFVNDPENNSVTDIELNNSFISASKGINISGTSNIRLNNFAINTGSNPVINIANSSNITLENFKQFQKSKTFMKLSGSKTAGIRILNSAELKSEKMFDSVDGAAESAVMVK